MKRPFKIGLTVVAVLALVVLVALPLLPRPRKQNGILQLSFAAGQRLEGYEVYNAAGQSMDIADITDRPAMVVFGMATCRDCIADISSYNLLYALYNNADYAVVFVWDDEIPQERLDEMNIPPEASFSARGRYKFTDWVPSYYFVDEADIILDTTTSVDSAADRLSGQTVLPAGFAQLAGGQPVLVGVPGCGACKTAYQGLSDRDTDFVYYLEGVEDKEEQAGATTAAGATTRLDPKKLITKAFGIELYPVLISFDKDGNIILDDTI